MTYLETGKKGSKEASQAWNPETFEIKMFWKKTEKFQKLEEIWGQ